MKEDTLKNNIFDAMTPEKTTMQDDKMKLSKSPTSIKSNDHHFLSVNNWVPGFIKTKSRNNGRTKDRRFSDTSATSSNTAGADISNTIDLELHIALSCGNVTNIVLGDLNLEEYDNAHFQSLYPQLHNNSVPKDIVTTLDQFFLEYHGRLEYAIGGDIVDSLDEALAVAKAGELSITPSAYDIVQRQSISLTFERRKRFFVIKNITDELSTTATSKNKTSHTSPLRHNTVPSSRKSSATTINNADYLKTLPGLRRKASKMTIEPLVPRVRHNYQLESPPESNDYYFKYINRSALYRMQHSVDGNLPAQFREVTIMFVSLGKTDVQKRDGLLKVQKAVLLVIQALVKYEGMLQQFAIDDKGMYKRKEKEFM